MDRRRDGFIQHTQKDFFTELSLGGGNGFRSCLTQAYYIILPLTRITRITFLQTCSISTAPGEPLTLLFKLKVWSRHFVKPVPEIASEPQRGQSMTAK